MQKVYMLGGLQPSNRNLHASFEAILQSKGYKVQNPLQLIEDVNRSRLLHGNPAFNTPNDIPNIMKLRVRAMLKCDYVLIVSPQDQWTDIEKVEYDLAKKCGIETLELTLQNNSN